MVAFSAIAEKKARKFYRKEDFVSPLLTNSGGQSTSDKFNKGGLYMQIAMIDSLFVNIDIDDYENELKGLLSELEKKKTEAKLAGTNNVSAKVTIQIGSYTFEVLPNGTLGHAYILHNNECEIKFSQFRSLKKEYLPISLRIKSEYLWAVGYEKAWNELKKFIEKYIGHISEQQVSRADLCCHTDSLILANNDDASFKGIFYSHEIKTFRRKVSGMNFGSRNTGKVYCRIYNKTLEVTQKRHKTWFFEIWKKHGLLTNEVWNVEFEIKREFLRKKGINSVEDLYLSLRTIWEYCTCKWLVKTNLDRTRIERSSIDERWKNIQHAFDKCKYKPFITVAKQKEIEASSLIPGIMGYLTSYGAKIGVNNYTNAMLLFSKRGNEYLSNKDTSFYKEVVEKRKLLIQEDEVNINE